MPVDNAGNSTTGARTIGLLGSSPLTFSDYVGSDDTSDYYRFTLDTTRNLRLTLSGLSADADLALLNSSGALLMNSVQNGSIAESITYNGLAAGTYFVRVYQFSGSTNYTLGASALSTTPTLSIAPLSASKAEGSSGTTPFTFTVTRSGDTSASTSVAYSLVHGTTNAADFSGSTGGALTFGIGQTSQTITVNVAGDQNVEADESFSVVLNTPVNGVLTTSSASALIQNDDVPADYAGNTLATARNIGTLGSTVQSFSDYVGTADTNDYYRFTLDATRNLRLTLGGLSADADLLLLNSTGALLRASAVSGTTNESISYDGLAAGTYYVRVYPYSGSTNYTLSTSAISPPSLSITALSASKAEGSSGTTPFTFTVTRSGDTSASSSVAYSLVQGTADLSDFAGIVGGTLTFGAGQTSQTITLNVVGDQNVEANESFSVVLSNAVNGVITTATATGTILNDDVAPPDYAGNTLATARNIGTLGSTVQSFSDYVGTADTNDYYRFTLDATRNLRLTLGGLSADADLLLLNSTGALLRTSAVSGTTNESISYDGLAAGTYYARVYPYSGSTNYTLSATALSLPSLGITALSATKAEGNSGTTPFTFTVTRSGDLSGTSAVAYSLVHGTTNAADFSGSTGGTISFGVGQSTQTITLNVAGDQDVEANESFSVVLSNAVNGLITTSSATGTITNDDVAPADYAGNTLTTARDIGLLGSTVQSFSDYVGTADTNDYYRFTLDATRNLRLTLGGLSANADLALLGSSGTVLSTSAVAGTGNESISYDNLAAGTYYLRVYPTSGSTSYTLGTRAFTPPNLGITALSASKAEGNSGTTPFTFTVTRSGDLSGTSAVAYSLVHGTTNAADFSGSTGGTISFGVGQSTQTITLNVAGDQDVEANESFSVVLSNAVNGLITTSSATGTITNDDVAPADYAGNTLTAARDIGLLGSTVQTFSDYVGTADTNDYYRFTLDGTRNLRLTLGGLSANADLALLGSSGTVLSTSAVAGTGNESISYDNLAAGTYYLRVYPASGSTSYTLGASALVPVASASITALSATKAEGNSGTTAFTFTVSRSASVGTGSVAYAVQGAGDASNGAASASDFTGNLLPSGTVSFADGELSKTLTIYVAGDTTVEGNERFSVTLSSPTNMVLGSSAVAYGIIQNDDTAPVTNGGINASISQVTYITVPSTVDNAINNLVGNVKWGGAIGTGAQLTYSFSTSASVFNYQNTFNGMVAHNPVSSLNAKQQQVATAAMGMVASVANITFTQVADTPTSAGDIRWSVTGSTNESTADAWFPTSAACGGDIWIGSQYADYADPDPGEYGYHTFVHELGHAMGLEHPHDGSPAPLPGQDQLKYSVMSYKDFAGDTNNGYGTSYYPISYMLNDIAALQYLYGANTSYHTGNDTYSWAPGARVYECIWDAGGNDTIDVGNQTQGCTINLNPGTWSSVGTAFSNSQSNVRDDLGIAYGAIIENATGSAYADTLLGNGVNNRLIGGVGADTLTGGAGADSFVFRTTAEGGDTLTDFSSAQGDKIQVVASNFGLTVGATAILQMGSSQPGAVGTGGQFLYASGTGQLWFDQDGTGSGQAVLLATLSNRPTLGASDIQLVGA